MLKLSWTNENVSFVEWQHELKKHFTIWEWANLPSETDPFFFMFMEGKEVSEALTEGKLILRKLSLHKDSHELSEKTCTPGATATTYNPICGYTKIQLIEKISNLWWCQILETTTKIYLFEFDFKLD